MERPTVWSRIRAAARGERDAETLYAYQRAGAGVHDQLDAAERRRFGLAAEGKSLLDMPAQVGLELVCTWNAFALQTLGDRMLEADEVADPASAGFVPPVTFDQVAAYYGQVQQWLAHASRAAHDPAFDLPRGTLPARLPDWSPVEPCPRPHLDALIAALRNMQLHLEAAMLGLEQATGPADAPRLAQLRGMVAETVMAATYATNMYAPNASQALHEQVEERAKRAVEQLYEAGQYVSCPALLTASSRAGSAGAGRPVPGAPLPLPRDPGFDPWVMTDPNSRAALQRDPGVVRVIRDMWALDPDPRASLELWRGVRDGLARGDLDYARHPSGDLIGYYFCAPYAAIYEAKRPVVIDGQAVPKGQRLTIECAPEGTRVGYPFKRELVLGKFQAAQIDYCDPDAPPPHEE